MDGHVNVLRFLNAIKNVWRKSNNSDAQDRAEKLSKILDAKSSQTIKDEWKSDLKCPAPSQEVEPTLRTSAERLETTFEHPSKQFRTPCRAPKDAIPSLRALSAR